MSEVDKLRAEIEWHKENSAKWQDTQAAHLREITGRQAHDRMQVREIKHLTAENEKLKADLAFADAQCAKVEGLFLGTHKENEKLRAAVEAADKLRNGIRAAGVKRMPELYLAVMAFDAARAALSGDKHE